METNKDYIDEVDNCRFVKIILMFFVLIYHSCVFWTGNWFTSNPIKNSLALKYLSLWLNSFHVYGFFLVSGYLFYYAKYERDKYKRFKNMLLVKIKRLLVPYVFVLLCWVLPFANMFMHYNEEMIVKKYLLGGSPDQLWFLLTLFWIFIFAYLCSDFWKTKSMVTAGVMVISYFLGELLESKFLNYFQIWSASRCMVFFWIGFMIRKAWKKKIFQVPGYIYLILNMVLFGLIYGLQGITGRFLKIGLHICEFLLRMEGAVMSFAILQKIAFAVNWKKYSGFLKLGKCSMPIYLLHQQIIYGLIFLFNGKMDPLVNALINFIISFSISLILSRKLLKKRITRFLIGEK